MRKSLRCIVVPHSPTEHFSDSSQREKKRKKLEHDRKEKETREHKERLEVRYDRTLSNGISLRPYCRKNLNARKKRRRQGNTRRGSMYAVTPTPPKKIVWF